MAPDRAPCPAHTRIVRLPARQRPGFSLLFAAGNGAVALDALAGVTDVDVVSSPSLMVPDNRQAVLQAGDQVPVVTRTAAGLDDPGAAVVVDEVEPRDTGVILPVVPRVSEGGVMTLEIAEAGDVATTPSSGIARR